MNAVSTAEVRGMDYQAIVAMRDQVARLTSLLDAKEEEVAPPPKILSKSTVFHKF